MHLKHYDIITLSKYTEKKQGHLTSPKVLSSFQGITAD